MDEGHIPKDLLYGELATSSCPVGCPVLHFKDVCKSNMKLTDINAGSWEVLAAHHDGWCHAIHNGVRLGKAKENPSAEGKDTVEERETEEH